MDALSFLSGYVPLFAGISEDALIPLAANSTLRQIAAGQAILRAGMTVDGLYVIATGRIEVHTKVAGKGTSIVAELGQGEVFGEYSILEKSVAGATVKAGAAGAVVLVIPEEPFRFLIEQDPAFGARVRAMIQARQAPPPKAAA